jgi:ribonucleoside-diphosphate reductase alpha chain
MPETKIVKRTDTTEFYDPKKVEAYLKRYVPESVDESYIEMIVSSITEYVELEGDVVTSKAIQEELYAIVTGLISARQGFWQDVAGCIKADIHRKEVFNNRGFETGFKKMLDIGKEGRQYTDFYTKYSDEELARLEDAVNYAKDYRLSHVGAHIAYGRYTTAIPSYEEVKGKQILKGEKKTETLQERLLTISAFLHQDETIDRMERTEIGYQYMSEGRFLPATPTFMNAGRPEGNLSSCFVGMTDDSLKDLYRENEQFANISKNAGGYGMYFGKVRSVGAAIRGKANMSSGSVPFMKNFDVTAGTVDQQGRRRGAITITQDIFHRDFSDFLKVPLDNTVLEKQMHNIFLAVSVPDIFFRKLQKSEPWHQFDPEEVKQVMGWGLEDCYDERKDGGTFTDRYEACVQAYKDGYLQLVEVVEPLTVLKEINRTRIEKGHPFFFFRDTVNRDNPNGGMIYCSNLCTEIAITMSLPEVTTEVVEMNGEQVIVQTTKVGDIPTCNLSSFNLGELAKVRITGGDWKQYIAETIAVQYRMTANVIYLNNHEEMPQTKISSLRKREVGIGIAGEAHALAISGIAIDSAEANIWRNEVFEEIAYNVVKASMEKAKETGDIAPLFHETKWADGSYIREKFIPHSSDTERWEKLIEDIKQYGMFSLVLMAIAPTETISYVMNTTAGADPIFNKEYTLSKAGIKSNIVPPDINAHNFFYYKDGFVLNKKMFLKGVGIRQRWIDQAISTNLYYLDDVKAIHLVQDYITAWKEGVKTLYYHRSQTKEAYETLCAACGG